MSDEPGAAGIGWLRVCAFHELPCSGVRTFPVKLEDGLVFVRISALHSGFKP